MTLDAVLPVRRGNAFALRAVVLLAGHVGRSPFVDGVGRSVLDLPVDERRTVFDVWADQLDDVARTLRFGRLRVLVSIDRDGPSPNLRPRTERPRISRTVVRDRAEYRGTAGVVRDLARRYGDDDRLLVLTAGFVQREPLREVVDGLLRAGEGVSVVPHGGGDLATAFLLKCGRLRGVPDVGFVDLKEQALPSTRGHGALSVVRRPAGSALPVRTLADYVRTLRALARPDETPPVEDAFAETWMPRFAVVEPGARVDPGASLVDSVVLAGGRVERGAVVARSVVCAGGVVRRGNPVVESVVAA